MQAGTDRVRRTERTMRYSADSQNRNPPRVATLFNWLFFRSNMDPPGSDDLRSGGNHFQALPKLGQKFNLGRM